MKDKKGMNNPNYIHGDTGSRLFRIWTHMRQRCNSPSDARYDDYGGRGITVCEEWDRYINFKEWALENGYSEELSIDRVDNDKGYSPDNCRWSTNREQCNNRRSNRIIEVDGISMNEKQWSVFLGIPSHILRNRLHRGMSEEKAIKSPVRVKKNGKYEWVNYYDLASKRFESVKAQMTVFDFGIERMTV